MTNMIAFNYPAGSQNVGMSTVVFLFNFIFTIFLLIFLCGIAKYLIVKTKGDKEKISKAKKVIFYSLIIIIAMMLIYAVSASPLIE